MRRHWRILATLTIFVLSLQSACKSAVSQLPQLDLSIKQPAPMASAAEGYLLKSINAERALSGLPAVKLDRSLYAAAAKHALEMAHQSTLSHRLQGEEDLSTRGSAAGAQFSRITENVAVGASVETMHGALMQSQHHRENILDGQVDSIGVAVVEAEGSLWAVEDFSRSVEQLSLDEQEHRVSDLLKSLRVDAVPTADARTVCGLTSGYVGARPALTMRYTTSDLTRLPDQLRKSMQAASVRSAGVGACTSGSAARTSFTSYNIAVVLYR